MKGKILKFLFLGTILFNFIGCTNNPNGTYARMNDAYNRKNKTEGRSMVFDTFVATTLMNYPELIPSIGIGKSKTHTKSSNSSDTVSNTLSNSQTTYFSNGMGSSGSVTTSQSVTKTQTSSRTKTKSKSVSGGIELTPNLDFYLK